MNALLKTTEMEARLLAREPLALFFSIVFPTLLLIVMGLVPALTEPSEQFGGARFIDYFAPSIIVLTLAMIALQVVPNTLAAYREQGVMRRLSVTPASPAHVLIAHLATNLGVALLSTVLVVAVGRIAFDVPLPRHMLGFVVAFVVGMTALFALGLIIAAVATTTRAASGLATLAFMVVMFFGGVYLPRFLLPDTIVRIGAYTPPGVQALLDGWIGTAPPSGFHLLIMGLIAVAAAAAAAKLFRWE
jgi:ABC-2 type transport system permease protein